MQRDNILLGRCSSKRISISLELAWESLSGRPLRREKATLKSEQRRESSVTLFQPLSGQNGQGPSLSQDRKGIQNLQSHFVPQTTKKSNDKKSNYFILNTTDTIIQYLWEWTCKWQNYSPLINEPENLIIILCPLKTLQFSSLVNKFWFDY